MEILSVYDSAFKPYGRVVEGYPTEGLVKALATTPCTDGVVYLRAWRCCTARRTPRKSAKGCTVVCPMSWATATATTRS